ncbi:MAG: DUF2294 domain-containing protein [Anaerolineae bacterium]|nr:MAG: DUF2294 domain-containing protein [Anaerolineae bacterium]
MSKRKPRGEYEDAFTKAIIKFEKEELGRGPKEARSYFLGDMILIRLRGILTPAESMLAKEREGRALVKETRRQLLESSKPNIEQIVHEVLGLELVSLYTDMSTETAERVIALVVDGNLDELFE